MKSFNYLKYIKQAILLSFALLLIACAMTAKAPSIKYDLLGWTLSVPIDQDGNGKADNITEKMLSNGYVDSAFFYLGDDGGMVFKAPVKGVKTSKNTTYIRSELRAMMRRGDTNIQTQGVNDNNWVFSSAPAEDIANAGGTDGTLKATLAVNHVTTTGRDEQVGRVIVGQIHANDDEPIRLYYRKLPANSKGSLYYAHEPLGKRDLYTTIVGSLTDDAADPEDGIALNEKFTYSIQVVGNLLTVKLIRSGKADIVRTTDMRKSGYDQGGQYMYFKVGVYNQNKTGEPDDYAQATFYELLTRYQ